MYAFSRIKQIKYQIIEKEIYSEANLLHFGEKHEMGEIVNEHFTDYSSVQLGDAIFESEAIKKNKGKEKAIRN